MITINIEETIQRPVEAVWSFMEDNSNACKWQPSVLEQRFTSTGPIGVGSTGIIVRLEMGLRFESKWRVLEYIPNQCYKIQSTSGPLSYQLTYTLEAVEGGTRLRANFQGEPKGFYLFAEQFIASDLQKTFPEDHARLKALLESKQD